MSKALERAGRHGDGVSPAPGLLWGPKEIRVIHIYIYTHTYIYTCMRACMHTYIQTVYVRVYIYIYIYIYMYLCIPVYTHILGPKVCIVYIYCSKAQSRRPVPAALVLIGGAVTRAACQGWGPRRSEPLESDTSLDFKGLEDTTFWL